MSFLTHVKNNADQLQGLFRLAREQKTLIDYIGVNQKPSNSFMAESLIVVLNSKETFLVLRDGDYNKFKIAGEFSAQPLAQAFHRMIARTTSLPVRMEIKDQSYMFHYNDCEYALLIPEQEQPQFINTKGEYFSSRIFKIAIDVQGTLEGPHSDKVINFINWAKKAGHRLTVWSNSGYMAKKWGTELGIEFTGKRTKRELDCAVDPASYYFDYCIDDDMSLVESLASLKVIPVHKLPNDMKDFSFTLAQDNGPIRIFK